MAPRYSPPPHLPYPHLSLSPFHLPFPILPPHPFIYFLSSLPIFPFSSLSLIFPLRPILCFLPFCLILLPISLLLPYYSNFFVYLPLLFPCILPIPHLPYLPSSSAPSLNNSLFPPYFSSPYYFSHFFISLCYLYLSSASPFLFPYFLPIQYLPLLFLSLRRLLLPISLFLPYSSSPFHFLSFSPVRIVPSFVALICASVLFLPTPHFPFSSPSFSFTLYSQTLPHR